MGRLALLTLFPLLVLCPPLFAEQYAFLVGVRDYSLNNELTSLRYPEEDVHALASTLYTNGVPPQNIILMTQRMAGRNARFSPRAKQISKEFALLMSELGPQDSVIVAFSGHGVQFKDDNTTYYCPLDAVIEDKATLVSLNKVYEALDRCSATRKLLVVDACRDDPLSEIRKSARPIDLEPVTSRRPPVLQGGAVALFSCSAGQVSFESPELEFAGNRGGGLFLHFVNRALAGEADASGDNTVDLLELELFTIKNVMKWARVNLGELQTPERRGTTRGAMPLVKLSTLPRRAFPPESSDNGAGKSFVNSVAMRLNLIPPGKFRMGNPLGVEALAARLSDNEKYMQKYFEDESPQHEVEISRPFYIGVTEVTQQEHRRVMDRNQSEFSQDGVASVDVEGLNTDRFPVENVSYNDAVAFCNRLSSLADERRAGRVYRLPSEAEWERACRANSTTLYSFGDRCNGAFANCNDDLPFGIVRSGRHLERTCEVGSYRPNAFGLFDMHGNVGEWCSDWYAENYYQSSPSRDPQGPSFTGVRVVRGGTWADRALYATSSARSGQKPTVKSFYYGFRVVCEVR